MRTITSLIFILFIPFLIFITTNTYAVCTDQGNTPSGGDIIVCDTNAPNPDTNGVVGTANGDEITVDAGAGVDFNAGPGIDTGEGDNIVIINNGDTANDVVIGDTQGISARSGNDDITVNGGFILGNINDGIFTRGGEDTVTVNNGTIEGFTGINTAADNDIIIINNVFIDGRVRGIRGGDGNDQITIESGTIIGATEFGIGTEEGDDTVVINSNPGPTLIKGDTQGILTSSGNDDVTVNGATIEGNINDGIFLSSGNDMATVNNANISTNATGLGGGSGDDILNVDNSVIMGDPNAIRGGSGNDTITIRNCSEILGDIQAGRPPDTPDIDIVDLGNLRTLTGTIRGGAENDTLIFSQTLDNDQNCIDIKNQIATLNPASDSITIAGITYIFSEFETIQDNISCTQLILCVFAPGNGKGCSLAPTGSGSFESLAIFALIPAVILFRRLKRKK
ncbi:MAG: right-handed parallel beta-helix repeat-containing protein [Thermodesulfobacteriota bacterium]